MDLFSEKNSSSKVLPLAVRMRPRTLKDFVGQEHILGPGKLLTRAIQGDQLASVIFYGPPGTGKTTLATVISTETKSHFENLNAVTSNVAEIRKIIEQAKERYKMRQQKTILFIDEIHRFNKSQQDVLMPDVEKGNPILIGATTHNPFFSIVPALLSRSLIFELKPLRIENLKNILNHALIDKNFGFGNDQVKVLPDALEFIAKISDGDARRALNALDLAIRTSNKDKNGEIIVDISVAEESIQKKAIVYDKDEDAHYDTISAYVKSMRGSDPDAAIYYLAKMLYAGEDTRFIARRLVICAAEDIGNADPQALMVATAAFQASEFIGMPEARIPLAQATVYLACAPKSNASYLAIEAAAEDVAQNKTLEVPKHLKDSHYKGAKSLDHGVGYQYAHDFQNHYVEQEYLSEKRSYYMPTEQGFEKNFKDYLEKIRKDASPTRNPS